MSAKTGKASSSDGNQSNLLQGREAPAYEYSLLTWEVCVCWARIQDATETLPSLAWPSDCFPDTLPHGNQWFCQGGLGGFQE